jgi:hypothetical protein
VSQPVVDEPVALEDLAFYLAVKHVGEQQSIAARTAAGLALLWPILRFGELDETTPAWLHAVTLQAEQQFRVSEQAAFEYVQSAKWAAEPLSDPLVKIDTQFPLRDFQLAMRATGPAAVKKATSAAFSAPSVDSEVFSGRAEGVAVGDPLGGLVDELMAWGKLNSTGAGVKFALNGGRGEVEQLVAADASGRIRERKAIGYARFTEDSDTGPCYFCAVLASQGAVYLTKGAFNASNRKFVGDGPAKVHDHCKCQLRPVYSSDDKYDERAKFFLKQWTDSPGGLKEFRRRYVRPEPYPENPPVDLAAVRRNRELVADRLGARSPQVAWLDRQLKDLA